MRERTSSACALALPVVCALACASDAGDGSPNPDSDPTLEGNPAPSSPTTSEPNGSPNPADAVDTPVLVRVYTDVAEFCQQTEDCGTRPEGQCENSAPTADEVQAAIASVGWDEERQAECANAIIAWDECALALSCDDFAVLDSTVHLDGEWICTDEGGVIIDCPSPLPCIAQSDAMALACGELDDALGSVEEPPTDLGANVALVDDGEDGDNTTVEGETGLFGYWYTFDDRCDCDNPDPSQGETNPLPAPHGGGAFSMSSYQAEGVSPAPVGSETDNDFGVRVWGGGHLLSGAGVGVGLANETGIIMPVDLVASGWHSLRFQMRNGLDINAPQEVEVLITDAFSEPRGGECLARPSEQTPCSPSFDFSCSPEGCFDSPRVVVTSTSDWQTFELRFDEFMREGTGSYEAGVDAPLTLDATRAYQLQFRVPEDTPEFDVWLDNVAFVGQ